MRTLTMFRIPSTEDGTPGILCFENGVPWMLTWERPWKDNKNDVSCIPIGTYECKKIKSPTHGLVFEITGVKDRTHVLVHPGNTEIDSKGCILLGRKFGVIRAEDPDTGTIEMQPGVLESKDAFVEFMRVMDCESFTLNIA